MEFRRLTERNIMNTALTPLLTSITKLPIDAFHIDTKNDIIKLNFDANGEQSQVSEIIFNEVTSFYYLDHDEEKAEDEKISLNNIMYCGDSMPEFVKMSEDEEVSIPNFIIELNDSNMFIEANSIVIDQEKYTV